MAGMTLPENLAGLRMELSECTHCCYIRHQSPGMLLATYSGIPT